MPGVLQSYGSLWGYIGTTEKATYQVSLWDCILPPSQQHTM